MVGQAAGRRRRTMFGLAVLGLALGPFALLGGCAEEFDPRTLVQGLRILAIQGEPTDLVEGEASVLTSLVPREPGAEVSYAWQWCPVTAGPNEGFRCLMEEVGIPEDLLPIFDLGDQPSAVFAYPGDADFLRDLCELVAAEADVLPDFVEVPSCDLGVDVFVRLEVTDGAVDEVAIKRIFLWFEEPNELQRNNNPWIDALRSAGATIDPGLVLGVAPGSKIPWFLVLDPEIKELFLPRSTTDLAVRREETLVSWFSTIGTWDRERSFSDDENFTLVDAGQNTLFIPADAEPETPGFVFFAVRDGRGGQAWASRRILVVEPSGTGAADE